MLADWVYPHSVGKRRLETRVFLFLRTQTAFKYLQANSRASFRRAWASRVGAERTERDATEVRSRHSYQTM